MYVFASLLFVHFFNAFRSLYSSNDDDDNFLILYSEYKNNTMFSVFMLYNLYQTILFFYDIEMYIYVYLQATVLSVDVSNKKTSSAYIHIL